MRAVTYARLSQHTESSTSIARQREETRARCEREGWDVVAELVDPSISGATARVRAQQALTMLRDGRADVLVVAAFDRWSRVGLQSVAELVEVLDERERAGSPALFVANRDGLTSSQHGWRIVAVVIAEVARQERELIRARVTASHAKLARENRWRGGTVPYAYRAEALDGGGYRLTVDEPRAEVMREAARRVLAGASAYAVVKWLNTSGIPTNTGRGEWSVTSFTRTITSPRMAGRVIYHDDVVRDDDGLPTQVWEPALPVETWDRVRAALKVDLPTASRPARRKAARLLSGLLRCSGCGRRLNINKVRAKAYYQCEAKQRASVSCPRSVAVIADKVEAEIAARFLAAHGDAEVFERVEYAAEDTGLADVRRAIDHTTEALKRSADVETFARLQALQARRAEIEAQPRTRRVELLPTGRTYAEAWAEADTDERRALIEGAYPLIRVLPATKGGRYARVDDRLQVVAAPTVFVRGEDHPDDYRDGQRVVDADDESSANAREQAAVAAGGAVLDAYAAAMHGEDSQRVRDLAAAWAAGQAAWASYVQRLNAA